MKKKILTVLFCGTCSLVFGALNIVNLPVTNITTTSAYFCAQITATNGSGMNPTATVFYGTVDAGTNLTWLYTNIFGATNIGIFSKQITGLSALHKYYYRWRAVESNSTNWASATSNFWTKPTAPTTTPAVVTISLQTDTNGLLKAPTNFFKASTNYLWPALGNYVSTNIPYGISASTAYRGDWGSAVSNTADNIQSQANIISNHLEAVSNAMELADRSIGLTATNTVNQVSIISNHLTAVSNAMELADRNIGLTATNTLNQVIIISNHLQAVSNNFEPRIATMETGNYTKIESDGKYVWTNHTGNVNIDGELDVYLARRGSTNAEYELAEYVSWGSMQDEFAKNSALTIFGNTNLHLVITHAKTITRDILEAWCITNTYPDAGTYPVGTYLYTNYVNELRFGTYLGRFFANKVGSGIINTYMELITTDGATTNILSTSPTSGLIGTTMTHYRLLCALETNQPVAAGFYMGVNFYAIKSGVPTVDFILCGGADYYTSLETPGLASVDGFVEVDPVWESEKSGYATGTPVYVESYEGTITGATIAAGSADSVVVDGPNAAFTWNTNAAGGAGEITDVAYLTSNNTFAAGTTQFVDSIIASNRLLIGRDDRAFVNDNTTNTPLLIVKDVTASTEQDCINLIGINPGGPWYSKLNIRAEWRFDTGDKETNLLGQISFMDETTAGGGHGSMMFSVGKNATTMIESKTNIIHIIGPTGWVGIAVANPTERLDVNGNENIRGSLYVSNSVILGGTNLAASFDNLRIVTNALQVQATALQGATNVLNTSVTELQGQTNRWNAMPTNIFVWVDAGAVPGTNYWFWLPDCGTQIKRLTYKTDQGTVAGFIAMQTIAGTWNVNMREITNFVARTNTLQFATSFLPVSNAIMLAITNCASQTGTSNFFIQVETW